MTACEFWIKIQVNQRKHKNLWKYPLSFIETSFIARSGFYLSIVSTFCLYNKWKHEFNMEPGTIVIVAKSFCMEGGGGGGGGGF